MVAPGRGLTLLLGEGNVLKAAVSAIDPLSGLCTVSLTHSVFDTYLGKWLEPSKKQFMMTSEQLLQLGEFLLDQ